MTLTFVFGAMAFCLAAFGGSMLVGRADAGSAAAGIAMALMGGAIFASEAFIWLIVWAVRVLP